MAELVIKISEELFNKMVDVSKLPELELAGDFTKAFVLSVVNGTPLPKGHGRIGDLDALEKEIVNGIKAGNYEEGYETFAHINNMDDCVDCVRYADTIIEADKVESEEK